jgi:hypothetical protein
MAEGSNYDYLFKACLILVLSLAADRWIGGILGRPYW